MALYLWYFFVYAFLGWCGEVAFAALSKGKFVNRGFLNGPLCPIYGCGVVGVLVATTPFQHNLVALYFGSVIVTTLLELITGFLMEKLFHHRWWDYSKMPLNIGGYVCPLFSFAWGFACVLIVEVIHPRIARLVGLIQAPWSSILLGVLGVALLVDLCVTIATVTKLNKQLAQIDELAAKLRVVSDKLGQTIASGALAVKEVDTKVKEGLQAASAQTKASLQTAEAKARADAEARYAKLVAKLDFGQRRLLKAFPSLRSLQNPGALSTLQERLAQWRKDKKHSKTNSENSPKP